MIEFECPKCGEQMEIPDRSAGRRVRCVGCNKAVEVPDEEEEDRRPRRRRRRDSDPGLSGTEWLLFTLLFLFIPGANVIVSSVLYYVWKAEQPRRANQINLLGFAVFGLNVLLFCVLMFAVGGMAPPRGR